MGEPLLPRGNDTSVAITGLACRFPGECSRLQDFWSTICNGKSAWSEIPKSRFDRDAFAPKIPAGAHFLTEDTSLFDAPFFSISADEARAMDPQQRLMLEVVYEALERAGYPLPSLAGSRTGVFMGQFSADYNDLVIRDIDPPLPFSLTGLGSTSLANRISWLFDLKGPSFTLDTACSSSLTALHLACQSLLSGEIDTAIVGGVNVMIGPDIFVRLAGQGFLAPDGRCKAFDVSANGYGRGEGVSVVILKRADDAVTCGDTIRAVVRGTGINQDGRTTGFTLPSSSAQASLIDEVYLRAGLDFSETQYVEAHGTGTKAGDLGETTALSRTISASRPQGNKVIIGSVKTNIGHLEAAAGLAGVIKSVLMLEAGLIPPNLHFHTPNPSIKFDEWNLAVATKLIPWPSSGLRRISVNSFGYGGANAHVIIDDAHSFLDQQRSSGFHFTKNVARSIQSSADEAADIASYRAFAISAQDKDGLVRVKKALSSFLQEKASQQHTLTESPNYLRDLAFTLSDRRSHLQWKTYCIASSLDELVESLETSENPAFISSRAPRLGFIFSGQGAQWPSMGIELLKYDTFRKSVEAADAYLQGELDCGWSAVEELQKGKSASKLGMAVYSQALCIVLQVALVDLLEDWDIVPAAVVGHSSGEIAAAYCLGVLSREHSWKIAYFRGLLSSELKTSGLEGAMMAVGASPEEVREMIAELAPIEAYVACINSPQSVTVSGDVEAIDRFLEFLQDKSIFARKLMVDTAYHSPHMEAMAADYFEAISDISTKPPRENCDMYSSVSGSILDSSELVSAYWIRNAVSTVQFAPAVQNLASSKTNPIDVLIEIGPHAALLGPATQSLKGVGITNMPYHSVLTRNEDAITTALNLAGTLFARGYPVNFSNANLQQSRKARPLVDLPSYPWNHSTSLWAESRLSKEIRHREATRSPLLGVPHPSVVAGERVWRGHIRLSEPAWSSWLPDHKIGGSIVCPGAGFLAMVFEAALCTADKTRKVSHIRLRDIQLMAALVVSEDAYVEYTISLRPYLGAMRDTSSVWTEFTVTSCVDGKALQKNCLGALMLEYETVAIDGALLLRYQESSKACKRSMQPKAFYRDQFKTGLQLGPTFQNLSDLKLGPGQSYCSVEIPDVALGSSQRPHLIHPTVFDSIFQTALAALRGSPENSNITQATVPKTIDEIVISTDIAFEAGKKLNCFSNCARHGFKEVMGDLMVTNEGDSQRPVLHISGFCCSEIAGSSGGDGDGNGARSLCSKLIWQPALDLLPVNEQREVLVRAGEAGVEIVPGISTKNVLLQLIQLVHHYKPHSVVSELVESASKSTPFLADSRLAEVSKTASLSVLCPDEDTRHETQELLAQKPDVTIEVKDLEQTLSTEESTPGLSDVIVVSVVTSSIMAIDSALQKIKELLGSGTRLCLLSPSHLCQTLEESVQKSLGVAHWMRFDDDEEPVSLLVGTIETDHIQQVRSHDEIIYILKSATVSDAAEVLISQLTSSIKLLGHTAHVVSWNNKNTSDLKGKRCIALLEIDGPILQSLSDNNELQALKALILDSEQLLWVSGTDGQDPSSAMITGLARVVRNEEPNLVFSTLAVKEWRSSKTAELILRVLDNRASDADNEYIIEDGVLCVSRVIEDDALNEQLHHMDPKNNKGASKTVLGEVAGPLKLCVQNAGLLDSLCFEFDPAADAQLEADEVEVTVKASSLNFRDVMTVMGNLPGIKLGLDAAGLVRRVGSGVTKFRIGDRVAMLSPGSHRTIHRTKVECCELVPDGMSFEEAATMPIVHGTAWYALVKLAQARKGQSLLIHAAAGGVGQAAIQLAKHIGMEIYATVGSEVKRTLLRDTFAIPDDHIFSSRTLDFAAGIKRMTNGRGVDVIINSLAGEALRQTWHCIAPFGCFVEIGLKDILENGRLDMKPFLQDATYTFFDITRVIRDREDVKAEVMPAIFDLQRRKVIRPITPLVVYPISEVESAFRQMQTGKHLGKIVLSFEDQEQFVSVVRRGVKSLDLDSEAAYVLVGGLGGLGRSISSMLADNGARKLCFLSRSGATSTAAKELVQDLQTRGVEVLVQSCDVANEDAVRSAMALCTQNLGRVRGVIQCAMVLRDTLFRNMTIADWVDSTRPKVQGTWNLHQILQNDVDFFVVLSSFAAIFGNRGQSNYSAAGAAQDAIAHFRRSQGMHAVTVDVGLMRDVGVLAEQGMTAGLKDWEEPFGIREEELSDIIKMAISGDMSSSAPPQILTGLATGGSAMAASIDKPWYLDDPKFAIMARTGVRGFSHENGAGDEGSMQARLAASKSQDEAAAIVLDALVARVAKTLQTTASEIDRDRFLHSYGIDSLAAIELVNWAMKECKAQMTVFDFMAAVPVRTLAKKVAAISKLVPKEGE